MTGIELNLASFLSYRVPSKSQKNFPCISNFNDSPCQLYCVQWRGIFAQDGSSAMGTQLFFPILLKPNEVPINLFRVVYLGPLKDFFIPEYIVRLQRRFGVNNIDTPILCVVSSFFGQCDQQGNFRLGYIFSEVAVLQVSGLGLVVPEPFFNFSVLEEETQKLMDLIKSRNH